MKTLNKNLNNKSFLTVAFVALLAIAIFSSFKLTTVGAGSNNNKEKYLYYTNVEIESGDTLSSIAEKYMSPEYSSISEYVEEIKEFNGMTDDKIKAGNYIMVMYYSDEVK